MPALLQELRTAIGFHKQAALQTPLVAADTWSLRTTSRDIPQVQFINEDDADDLGKGVHPTQLFKSHADASFPMNGRLTSEWGAMLACFGIGTTVKSGAGTAKTYTCALPVDFATAGLEMPSTTIVAAIRQGGSSITDKALIGMCCEEFGFQFNRGPGRDNALFTSSWLGSGAWASPSTITIPALATEHRLNAGGITVLTINGIDYMAADRFVSAQFSLKNNIRADSRYFPGSGTQSGFQIGGRMRRGSPAITCNVVVECEAGSDEEDNLLSQTEGTATITCVGDAISGGGNHSLSIVGHRIVQTATQIGEDDGIATYNVDLRFLLHNSNGVLTITAICAKDEILEEAA